MDIRLSSDLSINIGLSSDLLMDVGLSSRVKVGIGNRWVIRPSIDSTIDSPIDRGCREGSRKARIASIASWNTGIGSRETCRVGVSSISTLACLAVTSAQVVLSGGYAGYPYSAGLPASYAGLPATSIYGGVYGGVYAGSYDPSVAYANLYPAA